MSGRRVKSLNKPGRVSLSKAREFVLSLHDGPRDAHSGRFVKAKSARKASGAAKKASSMKKAGAAKRSSVAKREFVAKKAVNTQHSGQRFPVMSGDTATGQGRVAFRIDH